MYLIFNFKWKINIIHEKYIYIYSTLWCYRLEQEQTILSLMILDLPIYPWSTRLLPIPNVDQGDIAVSRVIKGTIVCFCSSLWPRSVLVYIIYHVAQNRPSNREMIKKDTFKLFYTFSYVNFVLNVFLWICTIICLTA